MLLLGQSGMMFRTSRSVQPIRLARGLTSCRTFIYNEIGAVAPGRKTPMPDTSTKDVLEFQAEVSQLLHLMIHSLYGNKEIFLRELVSNASDAADKLRFEAMSDPALFEDDPEPRIRVGYDAAARTITVSDNGIGMSRQEVVEQHRHHRQVRDARVPRPADRRPGQGRPPHRAVRRRLLRRLHRRRPGDPGHAARRPDRRARRPLGEHGRRQLHGRSRREGHPRDRRHPAPAARRGRSPVGPSPAGDPAQVLRPHRHPHPDEAGAVGQRGEGPGRHRRRRAGQPRVRALGPTQERDHRGAVPRAVQARGARRRRAARLHARQGRGTAGVHGAPLPAGAGAVRPVGSRAPPRREALRAPGVHHGRRRAADAGLPALRPRRGGLERSAAQRLPRDPAAVQGRGGDPVGRDQAGAGHARAAGREGHGQVRDVLEDVRPGAEGRHSRGSRQPRSTGEAAAVLVHPPRRATSRPSRWPTTSAG